MEGRKSLLFPPPLRLSSPSFRLALLLEHAVDEEAEHRQDERADSDDRAHVTHVRRRESDEQRDAADDDEASEQLAHGALARHGPEGNADDDQREDVVGHNRSLC